MNKIIEPKAILPPQPIGMKHRFHAMVKPVVMQGSDPG